MPKPSAIAIAAHPDDIEFYMAGTLLRLREKGWDIHYCNLSSGNCGSVKMSPTQTRKTRKSEAKSAAKILGAKFHQSISDDLEIIFSVPLLRRVSAIVRKSKASIVLTHSPQDYMEDHTETCRLAVTAAFTHGMPNFKSTPPSKAYAHDVTVYHAMPHGLRDPLRRRIWPGQFVNTTPVQETKLAALKAHDSQQNWLDSSQGLNSYLKTMDDLSGELGKMSRRFRHAEGWRRHLHYGFSAAGHDPLKEALGSECLINRKYEQSLEKVN
jgi:LmbE family N-acetylglucosaminyl deacetylase